MNSSYLKKINPKIIKKMNEISADAPNEIQEFFIELLTWQAESDEKALSVSEVFEGFLKRVEQYANNPEIIKYLEKSNDS